MGKLLIATTNPAKFKELSFYLRGLPIQIISLKDIGAYEKVAETGSTFTQNAVLKAQAYAKQTGLPTLADDGGLEIDALGGEPGVRTHRWIDPRRESSDDELIAYTFERMKMVPDDKRSARFRVVVAFCPAAGKSCQTAEGSAEGVVAKSPAAQKEPGFPFRALIFVPQFGKLYQDLSESEHEAINHRKAAIEKLKPFIVKTLGGVAPIAEQ